MFETHMVIGCQDRYQESNFNLGKLISHYNNRNKISFEEWFNEFRYLLNNYINSIVSIRNVLFKDFKNKKNFKEWWDKKLNTIIYTSKINLVKLRNLHQHENNGFINFIVLKDTPTGRMICNLDFAYSGEQVVKKIALKDSKVKSDSEELSEFLDENERIIKNNHPLQEILKKEIDYKGEKISLDSYLNIKFIEHIVTGNEENSSNLKSRLIGIKFKIDSTSLTPDELMKNFIALDSVYYKITKEAIEKFS
ncbi:hypothetical protein KRX57_10450 [Weeksellaceae bacterium TAE3-ERU29]|nr:hypothetical protein [Weeksellaceae bacterium TAE3-ERU29]